MPARETFAAREMFAAIAAGECDGELLRRFAQCGDQSAFSQLVERHAPMVLRMCRRMCDGDSHAAEDLSQRVFLDLASRAAALQTRTSLAGWIYRTSWNVSARYRRDQATRDAHERGAGAAAADGACDGGVPFAVITSELSDALSQALAALPESHRDALVLHYFAGHTVGQTAEVLGVRIGTAASWLSRGRDMLKAHLERHGMTLAANAVEAWLGEESARMLLHSPGEQAVHALEGKVGAPVFRAVVSVPPLLGAASGMSGIPATGLLAWGSMFGLSRIASSVLVGCLTIGGTGLAAAAVVPGGLNTVLSPFGSSSSRPPATGGGQTSSAVPAFVSKLSQDASSLVSTRGSGGLAAGSLPEPTGMALMGGIAALALVRQRRRRS